MGPPGKVMAIGDPHWSVSIGYNNWVIKSVLELKIPEFLRFHNYLFDVVIMKLNIIL